MNLAHTLNIAATATGIFAAAAWFWSARIRIPPIGSAYGTLTGVEKMNAAFSKMGSLNRWAAAATALSILLQSLAGQIPSPPA